MNQNPLGKFMWKLENEMLITFVNWQLIDSIQELDANLTKAASSCCWLMVKSVLCLQLFFVSKLTMTNPLQKCVNEFDQLHQSLSFIWWDWWIPDESWANYLTMQCSNLNSSITNLDFNKTLQNSEIYRMILSFEAKNDFGIYYHKKFVDKKRKVSFY